MPYELCGLIAASIHGLQRLEPSAVGFTHRKSSCLLRWGQYNKQRFCWSSGPSAIATYMPGFLLSLLQCNFLSFCHTLSCSTDSKFWTPFLDFAFCGGANNNFDLVFYNIFGHSLALHFWTATPLRHLIWSLWTLGTVVHWLDFAGRLLFQLIQFFVCAIFFTIGERTISASPWQFLHLHWCTNLGGKPGPKSGGRGLKCTLIIVIILLLHATTMQRSEMDHGWGEGSCFWSWETGRATTTMASDFSSAAKQHDHAPPVDSGPISSQSTRTYPTQVQKRSYKRAHRRACEYGYTWYKGRLYTPADLVGTSAPDLAQSDPPRQSAQSNLLLFAHKAAFSSCM